MSINFEQKQAKKLKPVNFVCFVSNKFVTNYLYRIKARFSIFKYVSFYGEMLFFHN